MYHGNGGQSEGDAPGSDEDEAFTPDDVIAVVPLDDDAGQNGADQHDADDEMELEDDAVDDEAEEIASADESEFCIAAHSKDVFCVDCWGGRLLASGAEDDTAALFDLNDDRKELMRTTGHTDSVNSVRFNASGSLLASGDMSGKIIVADVQKLTQRCQIDDCSELEWLLWHPSADILLAGCGDGVVYMWLIGPQGVSQTKVFASGVGTACTTGTFLGDGRRLLAGYNDGCVRLWSLKDGTSLSASAGPSQCTCSDVHESLPLAAVGTQDGRCVVLNTDSARVLFTFTSPVIGGMEVVAEEQPSSSVECVRFSGAPESWLAVCSNDGRLTVVDCQTGRTRHECSHQGNAVVACRWLRLATRLCLVSACFDGVLRVCDARNGNPLRALFGGDDEIFDLCVSPEDTHCVYTACAGGRLRMFRLPENSD